MLSTPGSQQQTGHQHRMVQEDGVHRRENYSAMKLHEIRHLQQKFSHDQKRETVLEYHMTCKCYLTKDTNTSISKGKQTHKRRKEN